MVLEDFNESGVMPNQVQMIDSTVIRTHHLAAGAKGGLKKKVLAAQKMALRPTSTSLPTLTDCLSEPK
jgi:urease alpha subunit